MRIELFLMASLFLTLNSAHATLGQTADSIEADRGKMSGTRRVVKNHPSYTVHEVKSDATTIHEYVSASGIVFGLAWVGLAHPDLTQLLGNYADEFKAAAKQTPRKDGHRHHRAVATDHVVVERWGHMRKLEGRAYDPALLPSGMSPNDIK